MSKPDKGYVGNSKRSDEMTDVDITTYYTLEKEAKFVKIKTLFRGVRNIICSEFRSTRSFQHQYIQSELAITRQATSLV